VLTGDAGAAEALTDSSVEGLRLLPAGAGLAGANVELPRIEGFEQRLRERLAPLRDEFEYILLDCPPSLGPLTVSALVAADRVIVPVQTEYFALEGLAGLLDTLALVQRELNPRLTVAGMLLTMHDNRTRLGRDVEREVREHFPDLVFSTVIPRNVRVGEAPSYGLPVTHHDPHSAGAEAYFELAKEVAARGSTKAGDGSGAGGDPVGLDGRRAGQGAGAARAAGRVDRAQSDPTAPALRRGLAAGAGRLAGRARRAAAGARATEAGWHIRARGG